MSDFAQSGLISTLQRLNDAHLVRIEDELVDLAHDRPIALILPCHAADLERPAFAGIVRELAGATFLGEIVLSMNGLDKAAFESRFRPLLAPLPQRTTLLFNDHPSDAAGASGRPAGKGANISAAYAHLSSLADGPTDIVATQDCDVASFRRADLARLCYAIAQPQLGYRFVKAYYSRVTDRLYGRVSRLFLAPLLHAMVRVAGHQPLVDFLASFRYPLAGETAMTLDLARSLPISPGWSLEISQLCEVFRRVDPRDCCQVDGGTGYDHKHQPAATALVAMVAEIAHELFNQFAAEGLPSDVAFRVSLAGAYRREATHALRRSRSLALINGIPFDESSECAIVEAFASRLTDCARSWPS